MVMRNQKILLICSFFWASTSIVHQVQSQGWFSTYQDADLMLSGIDFNQCGGALLFNHPNGLASDGKRLAVCDRFNNRILIWNDAPKRWDALPDIVLGQNAFDSNDPGSSKCGLNWPGNLSLASNGILAVADTYNDRLLIWNTFPTAIGDCADISIHLPSLTPPGTALRWGWPWGIWTDGRRLAAVATMGGTILFWNNIPVKDNQPPDYTITNNFFGTPRNISSDGHSYFFIGDHNARVTNKPGTFFWNTYPTQANQPFDFYRDEWIKGTVLSNGEMIASGLQHIYTWKTTPTDTGQEPYKSISPSYYSNGDGVDVAEANGLIYVNNYNGNNILVYSQPPDSLHPNPLFALSVSDYHHNSLTDIGYIQNSVLSTDGTRLIASSDFDHQFYIYNHIPDKSGTLPDKIIDTRAYNLFPWDHVLYKKTFAAAGKSLVAIWKDSDKIHLRPDIQFTNQIGTAILQDIKGIALDSNFFYLAERTGKVYIWKGIPSNPSINPQFTLDFGAVELSRLSSDGEYFCVTQQSPPEIYIYSVANLLQSDPNPWKTINNFGMLNLPAEAATYRGSLAIANQSFHDVLLWKNIQDAPDINKMIVLGNEKNVADNQPGIGRKKLFMPGSLLFHDNQLWVGEFKFSSRILKYSYAPTATENLQKDLSTYLYPNPAQHVISLCTNQDIGFPFDYEIVNSKGQIVKRSTLRSREDKIDVSVFSDGLYLFKSAPLSRLFSVLR